MGLQGLVALLERKVELRKPAPYSRANEYFQAVIRVFINVPPPLPFTEHVLKTQ